MCVFKAIAVELLIFGSLRALCKLRYPWKPGGVRSSGTAVTGNCELPGVNIDPNLSCLQKHQVLIFFFFNTSLLCVALAILELAL